MKLWYQSMTLQSAWSAYNATLGRILDRVKDADTHIEVHGITKRGGVGDQYRYLAFIETGEVLENVERATREGFDAFLIGNIADPGLREAREITGIPVLGLCETSAHLACMQGANFAIITGNEKHAPQIVENIARYGLKDSLHSVRRMTVERLVDLDAGFTDPVLRARLLDQFMSAARAAAEEGAEVIIPAIGVLMTLLADEEIYSVDDRVPLLSGVTALIKMGEAAVRMRALAGGHWTSKRAMYAPPPASQMEEMRQFYGAVYPAEKARK
ncbi:MAG: aspartate/glutamate racemase family protein [Pseudomonadota bacterium]